MKAWNEKIMRGVFFIAACTSVLAVALICAFLFANGIPAMKEIGFLKFLNGTTWRPNNDIYGIFPMILGSIYVTAGAIIIGVPIGILTSVFMAKYCPKKIYPVLKGATELLAGIPSVVYGFFGLVVLVPIVRQIGRSLKEADILKSAGNGSSILTASLLLGMMILPTIIGVTESAIRRFPPRSCEVLALPYGATHERSIFRVVRAAANPGSSGCYIHGRRPGDRCSEQWRYLVAETSQKYPRGIFRVSYNDCERPSIRDGICRRGYRVPVTTAVVLSLCLCTIW